MTSAEEFTKAFEYLDTLPCWQWHDFKVVPEEIANKVFEIIDTNTLDSSHRLVWCIQPHMTEFFMKSEIANINVNG